MLPLDLIIGFNNDEGLEAIVDLLMDPTNDTNFAQVLINLSFIKIRFMFHKVREAWDKVGPFKLFDQHEDEITEEVVNLSNEVNIVAIDPTNLFRWPNFIWVKVELRTTMEIIYRQGKARPSKLRMIVAGDCGHVLRRMVLGNYGRLDQVNYLSNFKG